MAENERRVPITKALKKVADWTSPSEDQDKRKRLMAVHVTPERIVAADGFTVLAVAPLDRDKWSLFGAESAAIDAAVWRRALTNDSITGIDASETVQITGESDVILTQPTRVYTKPIDFYKSMPKRVSIAEAKAVVFLNPEYLGRMAALAKALKCPSVRIQITAPTEPVRIDFKDTSVQVEIGIMPMFNEEVSSATVLAMAKMKEIAEGEE